MRKPKAPAFQLYVTDWSGSRRVRRMTLEERGGLITLLCFAWDEIGLPDDMDEIAAMLDLKATSSRFKRLWTRLQSAFYLQDGRWFNPRQERERAKNTAFRESQRERVNKRWSRKRGGDTTVIPRNQSGNTGRKYSPSSPSKPPTPAEIGTAGDRGEGPTAAPEIIESVMAELRPRFVS